MKAINESIYKDEISQEVSSKNISNEVEVLNGKVDLTEFAEQYKIQTPAANAPSYTEIPSELTQLERSDSLSTLPQMPPEEKLTMTAQELRERYDGTYRHTAAQEAWKTRDRHLENRAEKREKYSNDAESAEILTIQKNILSSNSHQLERLDNELADMKRQTENSLDSIDIQIKNVQASIDRRNTLLKMIAFGQKYVSFLGEDEERAKIEKISAHKQQLLDEESIKNSTIKSKIEGIQSEMKSLEEAKIKQLQAEYSNKRIVTEEQFALDRKKLFEKVRSKNQASRFASEKTAELLAEGKLSVSELARTTNSLVVHTLPLQGWRIFNTSMNNTEIDADTVPIEEKIKTVSELQPDLSVSIVSIDKLDAKHETMYPFGLIVDGSLIASYDRDSSTITRGDSRYKKYVDGQNGATLQIDPAKEFEKNSQTRANDVYGYNEALVHKPSIKGIFIDGERLTPVISTETGELYDHRGDQVKEVFPQEEEIHLYKKYGSIADEGTITGTSRYTAENGQPVIEITRKRSGEQKAIEFAQTNYPDLPVYIRRADGIYNMKGQPVTAEDIYTN